MPNAAAPPRRAVVVGAVAAALFTVILVAVVTDWTPLRSVDLTVSVWGAERGLAYPWWTPLWVTISLVLGPGAFRIVALGVLLWATISWAVRSRARRTATLAPSRPSADLVVAAAAVLVGGLVPVAVKAIVDRPRPTGALVDALQSSFPSSHAFAVTAAAGFAIALAAAGSERVRGVVAVVAVAAVVLVCTARVALAVHYLSDVAAGASLGVVWVTVVWSLWRRVSASSDAPA
ncbi:phosphatase PAP2 family protein [Microbacterium sp. bgisy203]|uniref:phosphatase PAP2 family protein n=1 Tax=Microbacterium sp. bgisy203 TaxID=3413799 RepID=UPI003D72111C